MLPYLFPKAPEEGAFLIPRKENARMKTEQAIGLTGGLISSIIAAACGSWQIIVVVFALYGLALFGNLGTGLLYAKQTGTYSQAKAAYATYKKGGMILGIIVVAGLDIILMGLASQAGITYRVPFMAIVLAGYAATHEVTSMLDNIKRLGNKIPTKLEDTVKAAEDAINQGQIPTLPKMSSAPQGGDPK